MDTYKEIELSNNALKVLHSRYLQQNNNIYETPSELFERVSHAVAQAELTWHDETTARKWEEQFYKVLSELVFLPNSPTLMNAGTPLNQLSACFVLPVEDSLDAIFTTLKDAAIIQQSGGGTGFNFSHLRPNGHPLTITHGTASGPVSFMHVFNAATEYIKYGGKRRGANMGVLNIDHPDIEEFIVAKRHEPTLNNFNLSVALTDAFMHSVEAKSEFNLVNPKTGMTTKTINAVTLWNMIVENAWSHGDPGLIFIDTINRQNPLPSVGRIEATNPCGEVPLFPYEACNLGSINLSRFVRNEKAIDWILLESVVNIAVRFLDDVIEISNYLLPKIKKTVRENRKIGLGVMGWADLLVQLNIPYDSEEAINLAEQVISFIKEKAIEASASLARERGTFPNWNKSIYYPSLPLRNATLLSIAPTGSISIIADTSSSIEPLFAIAFERKNVLNNATLPYINQYFLDYINGTGYSSDQLIKQVIISGKVGDIPTLPAEVKEIFKTALEISPEWHLKHQLIFQKYVDNAVSKTINLPPEANPKDISTIFMKAWKEQAKGITVFRYHSKEKQVLEVGLPVSQKACKVCTI